MRHIAIAMALGAALWVPSAPAGAAAGSFDVIINLSNPGAVPPPGVPPAAATADLCVSQALSDATGAVVKVVCRSGQFVSIEPRPGSPFLGVHGGAFRYYFASGVPASLRFLEGRNPWVGPGTVTSLRVNYLEDLDGIVEMQVGF